MSIEKLPTIDTINIEPTLVKRATVGTICVFTGREIRENIAAIAPLVADLNTLAFCFEEPTTVKETIERLSPVDSLLLSVCDGFVVGFASYQVIEIGGKTAIYQARGIVSDFQRQGLGRSLIQVACGIHRPDYFSARTQNPVAIWSILRAKVVEKIFPVDALYSESEEMRNILEAVVKQRGFTGEVDLLTGLQIRAYRMGRLGNYRVDLNHPGIAYIEKKLQVIGLDRSRGDAVYYMGKVQREV